MILQRFNQYVFPAAIMALAICVLCAGVANAVQPISGIFATYDSVTDSSDDYSALGGGSSDFPSANTYNITTVRLNLVNSVISYCYC